MLQLMAGIQAAQRLTRESLEMEGGRRSRAPVRRSRGAVLRALFPAAPPVSGPQAQARDRRVARPCPETGVD